MLIGVFNVPTCTNQWILDLCSGTQLIIPVRLKRTEQSWKCRVSITSFVLIASTYRDALRLNTFHLNSLATCRKWFRSSQSWQQYDPSALPHF